MTGYEGDIVFDTSKPDGTLRKLLDVSRMSKAGWNAKITLRDGIAGVYGLEDFGGEQRALFSLEKPAYSTKTENCDLKVA